MPEQRRRRARAGPWQAQRRAPSQRPVRDRAGVDPCARRLRPQPAPLGPDSGRQRQKPEPKPVTVTVTGELSRIYRANSITRGAYRTDNGIWNAALRAEKHLRGTKRAELTAVTSVVQRMAARHQLNAGNAEALAELPSFDTGAWSLYRPGAEDDLSYHELVTGFLGQLCGIIHTPVYCTTASHFRAYLKTPPALTQITFRGAPKRSTRLRFQLSKISHVGIVVSQGASTKLATSASFPYGLRSFSVPPLKAGSYSVAMTATDLAGNFTRITGTLTISGS